MTEVSQVSAEAQRKRLGQFFTGDRLARVLAALAQVTDSQDIIDPMGGSGDMLAACVELGATPRLLASIEIDPLAAQTAARRLSNLDVASRTIEGSAFDPLSWGSLPHAWDLVITNPPYVRYQTGSSTTDGTLAIPGAAQIRKGLIECLINADNLSVEERAAFISCAENYSGLADLAVPSLLLCCSRVASGGRLAVVIPNTWLSRDYAAPVLYILRRFFDIEFVVEDADMTWFPDALVRTTLVIARRTRDKGTPYAAGSHLRVLLGADQQDGRSLVGRTFPDSPEPEIDFARRMQNYRVDPLSAATAGESLSCSDESDLIQAIRHAASRHRWLVPTNDHGSIAKPPERLRSILPAEPNQLVMLADLGWKVGQGLRTGANDFFYVSSLANGPGVLSPLLPGEILNLPASVLKPAVRRQAEFPKGAGRTLSEAMSHVLFLEGWALPEDIEQAVGPTPWRPMEDDLARLVRAAAAVGFQRPGGTVRLPDLTAVRTNVRAGSIFPPKSARFWYHLPPFAPRHVPDLFVARVNGRIPRAYPNPQKTFVIDANFSTLWPDRKDAVDPMAMLAMMASSWIEASLEASGTVLGGGALKVEATHLRKLTFPETDEVQQKQLARLASRFVDGDDTAKFEIDSLVLEAMGLSFATMSVTELTTRLLGDRSK